MVIKNVIYSILILKIKEVDLLPIQCKSVLPLTHYPQLVPSPHLVPPCLTTHVPSGTPTAPLNRAYFLEVKVKLTSLHVYLQI